MIRVVVSFGEKMRLHEAFSLQQTVGAIGSLNHSKFVTGGCGLSVLCESNWAAIHSQRLALLGLLVQVPYGVSNRYQGTIAGPDRSWLLSAPVKGKPVNFDQYGGSRISQDE